MNCKIIGVLMLLLANSLAFGQQGQALLKLTIDQEGNISVSPVATAQSVLPVSGDDLQDDSASEMAYLRGRFQMIDSGQTPGADVNQTVPNLTFDFTQSTYEYDPDTKVLTLNTRVLNTGSTATTSNTELTYYLSADQNIVPFVDCAIGNDQIEPLAAGASGDERFSRVLCNASCGPGTWYIGLYIDPNNLLAESNENDNAGVSNATISLVCSGNAPDLTLDLNNTNWGFNATTCILSMNSRVTNLGGETAPTSWLGYYLSENNSIVTSDSRIGRSAIPELSSGSNSDQSFSIDLSTASGTPPFQPGTTYYVGWIVDYLNQVLESDENNNRFVSNGTVNSGQCGGPSLPNLVIDSNNSQATFDDNTCMLNIDARVVNTGQGQADGSRIGYYLSSDSQIRTSDSRIGEDSVGSLSPGAASNESISVDLNSTSGTPPITPGNSYFVGLICDYRNEVDESSEDDNTAVFTPAIQINCGSHEGGGCAADAADIALVLDRSGSMLDDNKLVIAKVAANTFIDFTQIGDNIAVASYAETASVELPLTEVIGEPTRTAARNAVNGLVGGGGTSIGAGMRAGQLELDKGQPADPNAMLLLSDGMENADPRVADVLPTIPDETDIYTIGLGFDVNANLMNTIANTTGGTYSFAPTASELQEIYLRIRGQITGQQTFATTAGTISPGQVVDQTVRIDASSPCVSFILTFSSPGLVFELVNPSGQIINPQVAASDPDIGYFESQSSASYSISMPQPGLWTLRINAVSLSASVGYFSIVQGISDLTLQAMLDKNQYTTGESILVCGTLTESGTPVTGATVTAEITLPGGSVSAYRESRAGNLDQSDGVEAEMAIQAVTETITLYDDGTHGDSTPDDGIYCNFFTNTSNDGSYEFTVLASGDAPQAGTFTRESSVSTVVNPGQVTAAILPVSPASVQGTANNRFDVLVEVREVTNIFGVSFDLLFENTHLNAVDVAPETFLGSDPVFLDVIDNGAGKVSVGVSRKAGESGVNGTGNVARVTFEVTQSVSQDEQVDFSITNVQANDPNGAPIVLQQLGSSTTLTGGLTVWPGDTDNNGSVNQADVLPVGLHFGRTGPSRQNASITWNAQVATPWNPEAATYADADGNGVVNQADVLAIGLNFGRTHTAAVRDQLAKSADGTFPLTNQQNTAVLSLMITGKANPGEDFTIDFFASEVADLFGLSFELQLSPTTHITLSEAEISDDNMLGSDVIFLSNFDSESGILSIGISRKAGQGGVNGSGVVARVQAAMSENSVFGEDTTRLILQNVAANDQDGNAILFDVREGVLVTSVKDNHAALPTAFALHQNYPNPFNPETVISYDVAEASEIRIDVFDLLGRAVRTLVRQSQTAGSYNVTWNGRDNQGQRVASGIYVYSMKTGNFVQARKLVLLR